MLVPGKGAALSWAQPLWLGSGLWCFREWALPLCCCCHLMSGFGGMRVCAQSNSALTTSWRLIDWLIYLFNFTAKTAPYKQDLPGSRSLRHLDDRLALKVIVLWVRALLLSCGQNGQELVICLSLLEIGGLSSWAGCNEQVTLVESGTGRQPQL